MTSETPLYKEQIKVFDLFGKLLGMQDKDAFYSEIRDEYEKTGKVSKQIQTVRLFLLNTNGGIYLTKRSRLKKENAFLYDKTIGAHIRGDESAEYTVLRECAEELGFPAAVLGETEFASSLSETDLRIIGVFKQIEIINAFPAHYKYTDGKTSVFPQITTLFAGVFDGPVNFKDGETSGIEIYYPDEVVEEIAKHQEKYTEDVKRLLPHYLGELKEIINLIPQPTKSISTSSSFD